MMGYFFPQDDRAVLDAARGLALTHPDLLAVCPDPLFVRARTPHPERRVALVSGGGAGHEPLHAGFVGVGGLDAACPGQVFTSPDNRQVYEAGRSVALPGGVLMIVKNYTGDVINFAIAAERLRADGIDVATVLVHEDIASEEAGTGRRGTAATVLVEKLLGAAADRGASLAELADLGARAVAASRSVAVAARAQTSGATGQPAFDLLDGELEYGVGIHGERARTTLPATDTGALVDRMLDDLLAAADSAAGGDAGWALLVNGLGAVTGLELHALRAVVGDRLADRGAAVTTSLVGTYTAALDMRGFSLTLMALEPSWAELLTAPTTTPALPALAAAVPDGGVLLAPVERSAASGVAAEAAADPAGAQVLERFTAVVAETKDALTALDQRAGDGDFGDNISGGLARATERGEGLAGAAAVFLDDVGGSSGPLFGLILSELASALRGDAAAAGAGLRRALTSVQRVGDAEVGDRTLVDALSPAADAAEAAQADPWTASARAALEGAAGTAQLRARRGRASYVGDRVLGAPDPGAVAIALLLVVCARVVEPDAAADLPSPADVVG